MAVLALFAWRGNLAGINTYVVQGELAEISHIPPLLEREYAKNSSWDFLNRDSEAMPRIIGQNEYLLFADNTNATGEVRHFPGIAEIHPIGWIGKDPSIPDEDRIPVATAAVPVPDFNGPPLAPDGPEFPPFPTERGPVQKRPFPEHRAQLLRRIGIFDAAGKLLWGNPSAASSSGFVDLHHKGQLIGRMKLQQNDLLMKQLEAPLAVPLACYLLAGAGLGFITVAILGWVFASQFERLIAALVQGSRRLVSGSSSIPLQVSGHDEVAEIAQNLNLLLQSLEQQDRAHKQWVTDTSHELRTPIAILRAQIEAFQDGIQEVNQKTLDVLYSQTMALQKLVDDLHDLAKFDMGELTCMLLPEDLMLLLEELESSFEERFNARIIDLDCRALDYKSPLLIKADSIRLRQLFANLYENSLRYTNQGGTVRVRIEEDANSVCVIIEDSPPGIPKEMMTRIFDRFFRIDSSRSRELGGSGIGLSISAAIAEAHGGGIEAVPSSLGGLQMRVRLLKELNTGALK